MSTTHDDHGLRYDPLPDSSASPPHRGSARRSVLVVIGGVVGWTVLFGAARVLVWIAMPGAFDAGGFTVDTLALSLLLGASVLCSLVVGRAAARLARGHRRPAVMSLALVQLGIGVVVQAATWASTPAWRHIAFLALLVPGHLLGARGVRAPSGRDR